MRPHQLSEEQNGKIVVGAELLVDAALIGVKVGLAQRADRDHTLGAIADRGFKQFVAEFQRQRLLGYEPARLRNSGSSAGMGLLRRRGWL